MKRGLSATSGALAIIAALAWALSPQAQAQNASDQAATNTQAGSTATPADQSAAENSVEGLQEVVVTAERRTVNIQQTPIAVTVVEGDQLQSLHINETADLQLEVPGFQASDTGGFDILNQIRGLGISEFSPSIQNGAKVILDGVLNDSDTGLDVRLFDQADVEVLEGPQGTFVGASAIAGAIEQNSVNPSFDTFKGYVLSGVGNYQNVQTQGAVNLPVNDTFALRLSFNYQNEHSFYYDVGDTLAGYYYTSYSATNPASDGAPKLSLQGSQGANPSIDPGSVDTQEVRLKALWKPTDNFQALSSILYSQNNSQGEPGTPNPLTYSTLFSNTGCVTQAASINFAGASGLQELCPGAGGTTHSTYYYPGETPFVLDYGGIGGEQYYDRVVMLGEELRYTLADGLTLRSMTGYFNLIQRTQNNISYGPQDAGWNVKPNGPESIPQEEIDLISPTTGRMNWITGAYWEFKWAPVPSTSYSVPSPYQPNSSPTVFSKSWSDTSNRIEGLFGQVNWQLTDTLQLQVGARDNWDNNFAYNGLAAAPAAGTLLNEPTGLGTYSVLNTAAACGTFTPPCYKVTAPAVTTGHYKDTKPTGKIDFNWTPLPGQNFYAFYARGYSAGGVNTGSVDHPDFTPETVNDWEAGWKGRIFDGHMLTQIGLYYEDLQNYEYPLEDTSSANDTSVGSYIANFTPSTIEGISVAEQSRFAGLGVDLSFDYNKTTMGSVTTVNQTAFPAGFNSPTSAPQCLPGHTYLAPINCFNYVPYQQNVGGEPLPFAPKYQGTIAVDYIFHIGGTATLDPRVTYSYTSSQYASIFDNPYNEEGPRHIVGASIDYVAGKWDTQFYGTNLTNQTYLIAISTDYYGAPRQYGLQETYRF